MRYTLPFILLICLLPYACAAKNNWHTTDSIIQQLPQLNGSNKLTALELLFDNFQTDTPVDYILYAGIELDLANRLKNKAGIANAEYNLCRAYMQRSNDPEALKHAIAALNIYESTGNKKVTARCYDAMGQIAVNHGNYPAAIKNYLAALKIYEAINDRTAIAYCHNRIGDINKGQRNYAEALNHDLQALAIFKETNNKNGSGSCYNSIGDIYENEGKLDEALENYMAAMLVLQDAGEKKSLIWPYYNIGEVHMLNGNYDSSLYYYSKALRLQLETKDSGGIAWTYNNIGMVNLKRKQYDSAELYCQRSLAIVTAQHEISGMRNASKNLSAIYESKGDHVRALQYYKAYKMWQDTLFNRDNTRNLVSMQMQYDFDKQTELEKVKQNKKDQLTMITGVLFVLIGIIIIGAYRNKRKESVLKSELLLQKEESIVQKEMLMREIHHRVKNNLQVIGTLLELQLASITDTYARDAITESSTRLKAISLIHQQLYRDAYMATVECSQFTTDLHSQVSTIFINAGQHITLHNEMPPIILDIDTAVPLGLILNELMTNSYKYAFKGIDGSIDLRIEKNEDTYTLKYKDSGPGLPDGFDLRSLKSLGILIMQSLSKQIGGAFTYSSETKTFTITFRDAAEMRKEA